MSFLTSSTPPSTTSSQTTNPTMPSWLTSVLQGIVGQTNSLTSQPYQAYTGQRVADLNSDENQAASTVQGLLGSTNPAYAQSQSILNNVANFQQNGPTQSQLNQYMNPYINNVLDQQNTRDLNAFQLQKNQLQAQDAATGAFGGSGSAIGQSNLLNNFNQNEQVNQSQAYSNAYTQGLSALTSNMNAAGTTANNMFNNAVSQQNAGLAGANALNTVGQQQQANTQANLDVPYQNYLTAQHWPYQQLQFALGIVDPIAQLYRGQTSNSTTTQNPGSGSILSDVLGGAASLASLGTDTVGGSALSSLLGSLSGSSGAADASTVAGLGSSDVGVNNSSSEGFVPLKFARGGLVQGYANGGQIKAPHGFIVKPSDNLGASQRTAAKYLMNNTVPHERKFYADGGSLGGIDNFMANLLGQGGDDPTAADTIPTMPAPPPVAALSAPQSSGGGSSGGSSSGGGGGSMVSSLAQLAPIAMMFMSNGGLVKHKNQTLIGPSNGAPSTAYANGGLVQHYDNGGGVVTDPADQTMLSGGMQALNMSMLPEIAKDAPGGLNFLAGATPGAYANGGLTMVRHYDSGGVADDGLAALLTDGTASDQPVENADPVPQQPTSMIGQDISDLIHNVGSVVSPIASKAGALGLQGVQGLHALGQYLTGATPDQIASPPFQSTVDQLNKNAQPLMDRLAANRAAADAKQRIAQGIHPAVATTVSPAVLSQVYGPPPNPNPDTTQDITSGAPSDNTAQDISSSSASDSDTSDDSDSSSAPSSLFAAGASKDKTGVNLPLLAFGSALLGSKRNFFSALGDAGTAAVSTISEQRKQDIERQQAQAEITYRNRSLDAMTGRLGIQQQNADAHTAQVQQTGARLDMAQAKQQMAASGGTPAQKYAAALKVAQGMQVFTDADSLKKAAEQISGYDSNGNPIGAPAPTSGAALGTGAPGTNQYSNLSNAQLLALAAQRTGAPAQ